MLQRYNIQSESDIRHALELRGARITAQNQENRTVPTLVSTTVQ